MSQMDLSISLVLNEAVENIFFERQYYRCVNVRLIIKSLIFLLFRHINHLCSGCFITVMMTMYKYVFSSLTHFNT